jgi:hypothetical protein
MLSFLKSLFKQQAPLLLPAMPVEFPAYARKAIQLITESDGQRSDEEILALLTSQGIPQVEATELLLFLPIAFCRHLLPALKWPAHYVEFASEKQQYKVFYNDNPRFGAIQEAMLAYAAGQLKPGDFHKIAGRSTSFHALNALSLKNPGRGLSDAFLTAEYITR